MGFCIPKMQVRHYAEQPHCRTCGDIAKQTLAAPKLQVAQTIHKTITSLCSLIYVAHPVTLWPAHDRMILCRRLVQPGLDHSSYMHAILAQQRQDCLSLPVADAILLTQGTAKRPDGGKHKRHLED